MKKPKADTVYVCKIVLTHYHKPLHVAAQRGSLPIIKLLVEHGADIHAINNEEISVVYLAAKQGKTEVVKYLLKLGADGAVRKSKNGFTGMIFICIF